jgi:hypothetical protein
LEALLFEATDNIEAALDIYKEILLIEPKDQVLFFFFFKL